MFQYEYNGGGTNLNWGLCPALLLGGGFAPHTYPFIENVLSGGIKIRHQIFKWKKKKYSKYDEWTMLRSKEWLLLVNWP